jgi:hypothetical protein
VYKRQTHYSLLLAVPRAAWPLGTATPAESNTSWYAALRVPEKGRYQNIISTDLVLIIWIISMINTNGTDYHRFLLDLL